MPTPKEEALTVMKFMRRPALDNLTRVEIAVQAVLRMGVYGEITRIAQAYQVSRLFVYKLVWQLLTGYALRVCEPSSTQAIRKEVAQHILLLRLEGHCSLERISHIIKQLGLSNASVGYISQRLTAYARALPQEVVAGAPIVLLLCDEICTLGQPILLTVEPRSLAILKIELVDNREAETWKKPWEALAEAGLIEHPTVVADQGAGLVKGCALMGLLHHPDWFHLLRPLARFGERFSRQALAAIAWEYARGSLEVGRSAPVITKRMASYEAAQAAADEKISRYDHFCYLWAELRKALELFNSEGRIQAGVSRQAEMGAIVALMRELGCAQLKQALSSCASGLEGYWSYDRRAEEVYQGLMQRYPRDVVEGCACGWQLQRQSTHSKDYGMRQRWAQEAEFSDDYAGSLLPEHVEVLRKEVEETLDAEVRSSSLVEKINAALRPRLATCRGQVDQAMLELFAYGHNHRRFVRGKRAGKAPIEILTGKEMETTWLDSLLETA
jgi:hypothetical protein